MRDDTAVAEEARTIADAVLAACAERDWTSAVRLIEGNWSLLLDERRDDLDTALQAIPLNAVRGHPQTSAIRDIRLHTSADAVERMLGPAAPTPHPDDTAALDALARSDNALQILGLAGSRMISYRLRGRLARARELAILVERLGRIADVHQPSLVHARVPSALLQAGITRGLSDDVEGAMVAFRDAYERSPHARSKHVGGDAAGKAALFAALSGDIRVAQRWLVLHETSPQVGGWRRSRVDLTANAARCLIAIETLDRTAADAALQLLEQPVNTEQSWGGLVTFIASRHALVWGDRLGAVEKLQQDRRRFAPWMSQGSTLEPLLDHVEVDLRLSLRHGHRARLVVAARREHAMNLVARARLSLLIGDYASAAQLAAQAVERATWPRTRMEALAVQTAANVHAGEIPVAREAYGHLAAAITSTGSTLVAHTLSPAVHDAVGGECAPRDSGSISREIFPVLAESVRLTAQQRLVLTGLASGATLREIGAEQHLSHNTVKSHVRALYARLGATSRDQAIARAYEEGLL